VVLIAPAVLPPVCSSPNKPTGGKTVGFTKLIQRESAALAYFFHIAGPAR
jgi:hypothetical protein